MASGFRNSLALESYHVNAVSGFWPRLPPALPNLHSGWPYQAVRRGEMTRKDAERLLDYARGLRTGCSGTASFRRSRGRPPHARLAAHL